MQFRTHYRQTMNTSASPPLYDGGGRGFTLGNCLARSGSFPPGPQYPLGFPQWLGDQGFYWRYFNVMSTISVTFTLQKPADGQFLCTLSPVYSHSQVFEADQAVELYRSV